MQLMTGQRQHINAHLLHINAHMTNRLYRIGVEQHAVLVANIRNRLQILNGADFVVCCHDGYQRGILCDGIFQLIQLDMTLLIYADKRNIVTDFLHELAGVQDSMVLDGAGDNMTLVLRQLAGEEQALDCQIVRLGTAGSKVNLVRVTVEELCQMAACFIHRLFLITTQLVQAGRVAITGGQVRQHRVIYVLGNWCGSRVIRINNTFHISYPPKDIGFLFSRRQYLSAILIYTKLVFISIAQ